MYSSRCASPLNIVTPSRPDFFFTPGFRNTKGSCRPEPFA